MKTSRSDRLIPLRHAGDDPEILACVARLRERFRAAADTLLERLLVEGLDERLTVEDIERLCITEKLPDDRSPTFIRKVVIDLIVCLRQK